MGEVKERVGEKAARVSEKAQELKSFASEKTEGLKERVLDTAGKVRENLSPDELRMRAREHEGVLAIAALVAGALFGLLMPQTQRELKVLTPAKEKMRALGGETVEKAQKLIEGDTSGEEQDESPSSERSVPSSGQPEASPSSMTH
jgi:hypothetical protein